MTTEYTESIEELVTYNLGEIDPRNEVSVNLADLIYVYNVLQEYMRFFHQPKHYPELSSVEQFLGSLEQPRGFRVMHTAIYEKLRRMIPEQVSEMYDEGKFDCPKLPWYYKGEGNHGA